MSGRRGLRLICVMEGPNELFASRFPELFPFYGKSGKEFASHDTVSHSLGEDSRHDPETGRNATTNAVEGFFGNTKRSLDGTHHRVSKKYLPLYLAEIDHKYNTRKATDGERTASGIEGVGGKRLMLRRPTGRN